MKAKDINKRIRCLPGLNSGSALGLSQVPILTPLSRVTKVPKIPALKNVYANANNSKNKDSCP